MVREKLYVNDRRTVMWITCTAARYLCRDKGKIVRRGVVWWEGERQRCGTMHDISFPCMLPLQRRSDL